MDYNRLRPRTAHGPTIHAISNRTRPLRKLADSDLEQFLPRRSFYSCHERALRLGGYDPVTGRPAAMSNGINRPKTAVPLTKQASEDIDGREPPRDVRSPYLAKSLANVAAMAKVIKIKRWQHEDIEKVGCSLVLNYLRLVESNKGEYLSSRGNNTGDTMQRISKVSLVKLGRLFREGHHCFGRDENIVVTAAYEINPRDFNPSLNIGTDVKHSSPSPSGTHQKSLAQERDASGDDGASGTELDKCRAKLWRWLCSTNTGEIYRAREAALCEMGLADYTLSYWWESNRTCRYLRDRSSLAATEDTLYEFI